MKLLSLLLPFIYLYSISQNDVAVELHKDIYEIPNQYFYSEKVHTYLFDLPEKILLFDIPTFSADVKAFILSFGKPVEAILSHGSCGIADGTKWQEEIGLKVYAHKKDETHPWMNREPNVYFTKAPNFHPSIKVIHTPGHSEGSICILETKTKSLFTGDTIYGDKNGNIKDIRKENAADYEDPTTRMKSCQSLLKLDFENIYPFHYEILLGDAKNKLQTYLDEI